MTKDSQVLGKTERLSISAAVLPVGLVATMAGLYLWGPTTSHESPGLLLSLNFFFTTLISGFIATLAGRSFLISARPALLAICVGMIVWGASAFVAVVGERIGNYNLTIHNLGVAVSGLSHLTGAVMARRRGERSLDSPGTWLSLGVATAFCAVGAIWMSAQQNWLPPFFIDGYGATPFRTAVLVVVIGMFSASAVLTGLRFRTAGWVFLLWYSLGLALIAAGAVGLILQPTHGSWLGWAARTAQYMGGIYMLIGAVMTMREAGGWHLSVEERLQRSEQALRNQAELIRNVNDNTSELIFMKDRSGRLTYANAATLRLLGLSSLAEGTNDRSVFPNQIEHAPIAANDRQVMELGQLIEVEEVFTGADGRPRTFLSTKSPLRDTSGQIIGVIGVSRDITERVVGEEQLRRAKEAAEAANAKLNEADRRKDEFLAILAHELRNPLAPVRNAVQVLHMKGSEAPELQWARDVIDRQVQHLTRLIDDLIDVSRISRGKIELKRERVELSTIVQRAVEASRPVIEQFGHELTVNLLPQTIYLDADLTRLAQVFCNLLNNAAKYTDRGGRITISADRQESDIVVSVRDTGIGIPMDMLSCVFEMFKQVDHSSEKSHSGLGIGLTLAKRLVEMHGGSIDADSEGRGKGSVFLVRLPIVTESSSPGASGTGSGAPLLVTSHRIFVVDDNRDAADSLGMMLRMMGNEVRRAYDGAEAVSVAADFRPTVSLLDIGLPKLNGYDTARAIRNEPWGKNMFLIAITGWGQEEDRRRSKEAGFDQHLVKPVSPQALMQLLAALPEQLNVQ
jgi:PAS domain S-box-containing protein